MLETAGHYGFAANEAGFYLAWGPLPCNSVLGSPVENFINIQKPNKNIRADGEQKQRNVALLRKRCLDRVASGQHVFALAAKSNCIVWSDTKLVPSFVAMDYPSDDNINFNNIHDQQTPLGKIST